MGDGARLARPRRVGNYSVDELQELADCVNRKRPRRRAKKHRRRVKQMMIDRLTVAAQGQRAGHRADEFALHRGLVGTHPLLEDFKLIHRALDVKKVQAEVRHAELENVRLAARALEGEREDPDIEKKIVIEGPVAGIIPGD